MHILHACDVIDGKEWGKAIKWPRSEIPLNLDAGHKNCPYCQEKLEISDAMPESLRPYVEGQSTGASGQQGGLLSFEQIQQLLKEAASQSLDEKSIRDIIQQEMKKALKDLKGSGS